MIEGSKSNVLKLCVELLALSPEYSSRPPWHIDDQSIGCRIDARLEGSGKSKLDIQRVDPKLNDSQHDPTAGFDTSRKFRHSGSPVKAGDGQGLIQMFS